MNIVGLLGKISTEVGVKPVGNTKVANFLLSVRGAGKWNRDEETHNYGSFAIEAWGKLAETLEKHCSKGTIISISGALKQDTWEDNGNTRERVKIVITSFNFVNSDPEAFVAGTDTEEDSTDLASIDPFG